MAHDDGSYVHGRPKGGFPMWRMGLALVGFLVIAGVLLLTVHRAHVLGALIYLPLLLCPLMHMFMHRGHGGHGGGRQDRERSAS